MKHYVTTLTVYEMDEEKELRTVQEIALIDNAFMFDAFRNTKAITKMYKNHRELKNLINNPPPNGCQETEFLTYEHVFLENHQYEDWMDKIKQLINL